MAVVALLLRVVTILFLLRLGVRFVAGVLRGYRGTHAGSHDRELVRDRVCNTFVPRERALHAIVDGHEQHFCSTACRDRALATGTV